VEIRVDDLQGSEIHALLEEHLAEMHRQSPPGSCHALDVAGLRQPDITFWSMWDGPTLVGCGALKQLERTHGEIKSMRTSATRRRQGVGSAILTHIVAEAQRRAYHRLSLETGAQDAFRPAREFYESFGFSYCPPFGEYVDDPNSVFLTRVLSP
jgi:putative acetyltransferase